MPTSKQTRQRQYYALHDAGLQNGSFYRDRYPAGHGVFAHYMNGDYMGFVDEIPEGFVLQEREHARKLVPKICGD